VSQNSFWVDAVPSHTRASLPRAREKKFSEFCGNSHEVADVKGRLIAILLTTGEAHDCPIAERLVRRVKPSKRMLGDKACAELRERLHERGTKPVIPKSL